MNNKVILKTGLLFLLLFICFYSYSQLSLHFTENKGQWPDNVLYKSALPEGALFLENNCLTFTFYNPADFEHSHAHNGEENEIHNHNVRFHAFKIIFKNSNPDVNINASGKSSDYYNFFIGKQNKWASSVYAYSEIIYENIYPNIDFRIYFNDLKLKYDFIVHPGGDPDDIRLEYEGVSNIKLIGKNLKIYTTVNEITDLAPIAYQDNYTKNIKAEYYLNTDILSFNIQRYKKNKDLIIDPTLVFSTYTGSTADNWGFTATFDYESNVYSGGIVVDIGYPVSTGAYQVNHGGMWDVGIIKYTADGTSRIFATYLGGSSCDLPHSMIVDLNGNLIIFGTTGSQDFPVTYGAYDTSFNGGDSLTYDNVLNFVNGTDIYVAKLNPNGTQMIGATYIGGTSNDGMNFRNYYSSFIMHGNDSLYFNYADGCRGEVIIDENQDIIVGTTTFSNDFPTTFGCFQPNAGGRQDGVVFKLSDDLTQLMWSSYFGGSLDDAIYSVDVDNYNDVYITGGTSSTDIITTPGVYKPTYQGGTTDAFVAHVSSDGSTLVGSTYFGSSSYDQSYFVRLDKTNNIYITGQTKAYGTTLIYNANYNTPNSGQFIAKFPNDLTFPIWSTVFGTGSGKPNISLTAFAVDYCDRIYLAGWGREWADHYDPLLPGYYYWNTTQGTKNMDITPGAYQTTTDGQDFYVMVMADDASQLEYASYFGEVHYSSCSYSGHDHVDGGTSRFDKRGNIYQSICASCGGCQQFPTYPNPGVWSNTNNAYNCNNAVFKFSFELPLTIADFPLPQHVCAPYSHQFTNNSQYAVNYLWNFGDGTTSTLENPSHTWTTPGTYTVMLIATDTTSCNIADTAYRTIEVHGIDINLPPDTNVCQGQTITLLVSSNDPSPHYIFSSNPNFTDTLNSNINNGIFTTTPNTNTTYYVFVDGYYCDGSDSININIIPLDVDVMPDSIICAGDTGWVHITNNVPGDTLNYIWNGNNIISGQGTNEIIITPTSTTTYYVTATNSDGCVAKDTVTIDVSNIMVNMSLLQNVTCYGDCDGEFAVNAYGGISPLSYIWSNGTDTINHIYNLCPGTYTVTVTDAIGCSETHSETISEPSLLEANITNIINATCDSIQPNTGSATVNAWGGTPGYIYHWSNNQTSQTISNLYAGTYTVTVSDMHGCDTILSVFIDDGSSLEIATASDSTSCYGYCDGIGYVYITTQGVAPYNYIWDNGQNLDIVNGLCAGYHYVTVTDSDNCVRLGSVFVYSPAQVQTSVNYNTIICYGDSTDVFVTGTTGGTPGYNYVWNDGTTSQTLNDVPIGTYYVITTDSKNCKDTTYITVTQPDSLVVNSTIKELACAEACNGKITVTMNGGVSPYYYEWSTGENTGMINHLCSGNYDVTITDNLGCTITSNFFVDISDYVPPLDAYADDYYIYESQSTQLHATDTTYHYIWTPVESLENYNSANPIASPTSTTTYQVKIIDKYGCINIDTVTVNVMDVICDEPYIYVPNAFSPNGDGKNDILYVQSNITTEIYFAIYDRWGEIIFETTDINQGWDGTYKGKIVPPDVFVYYMRAVCLDNKTFIKKGNITLIR